MGKILIAALLAGSVLGAVAERSAAAPMPSRADVAVSSNITDVAVRCGRHAHYVPAHRNRAGHRVRGRCVRNR